MLAQWKWIIRTEHDPVRAHCLHQILQGSQIEHRRVDIKTIEVLFGRQLADSMRNGMMLPGILQSPQQKNKTPAAMCEADSKLPRQLVEGPAEDHRHDTELCFSGHADSPRHHVLRHP